MQFLEELERHGPTSSPSLMSLTEARAYCEQLATSHYENFSVLTSLTPKPSRPHFAAVYAFCRWSDDLGDEVGDRARSRELLAWWDRQLQAMYAGEASHPILIALADTVKTYEIPIDPFRALISAFAQDQDVLEYPSYEQLHDYCTLSADPVGRLVLYLCNAYSPRNAQLSDLTCTGLQLANFWQDVSRDLDIGRIYLPADDRQRFGLDDQSLRDKRFTNEYRELLRFEVLRARNLLLEGRELLRQLHGRFRLTIDVFNRGGLAILDAIERAEFDTLSHRPQVSKTQKIGIMVDGLLRKPISRGRVRSWPLASEHGR